MVTPLVGASPRFLAIASSLAFIAVSLSHSVMVRLWPVARSTSTYAPLKPPIFFIAGKSTSWSCFTWASSMFSGRVSALVTRANIAIAVLLRRRPLCFA